MPESMSMWEHTLPESLVVLCSKYCVKNLGAFCSLDPKTGLYNLQDGVMLPWEICERFINTCHQLRMCPGDSFINIFSSPATTRLRRANVSRFKITDEGVRMLLRHSILTELDISECEHVGPMSLEFINEMGKELLSLNLGANIGMFSHFTLEDLSTHQSHIINTPNLKKLVLHDFTPFEKEFFSHIFNPLNNLTYLDVSGCSYAGYLTCVTSMPKLQSLILHNVPDLQENITCVCALHDLKHLDVSQTEPVHGKYLEPCIVLSKIVTSLLKLESLDISGTNLSGHGSEYSESPNEKMTDVHQSHEDHSDIIGLQSRVRNPLQFLGLLQTSPDASHRQNIPARVIAGTANEEQILVAAEVYNRRPDFLREILNELFYLFQNHACENRERALEVLLRSMELHVDKSCIQISGSASLYYIIREKNELSRYCRNVYVQRRVIRCLLDAMEEHRDDNTMLRNGCLLLMQLQLPEDIMFDYLRLVSIILNMLKSSSSEEFIQRIGIHLLNQLACQMEGEYKQLLGDRGVVTTLISLIDKRLKRKRCDDVMETAWSALWNITDETAINCERFLEHRGMLYFLECLEMFPSKAELLRNMMGLLGNVAEVKYLRPKLMTPQFVHVFYGLLESCSNGIEVSYNAAGVLSHLASDGQEDWLVNSPSRKDVLDRIVEATDRWKLDSTRNINYRSFEPILRLVKVYHTPQCQHWAVWALANLTTVYPDKYCPLIESEDGLCLLDILIKDSRPYTRTKTLAKVVIENCRLFKETSNMELVEEENLEG